MGKRFHSGWWLEQKYWVEEMTQAEIAEVCGVSPRAIRDHMKRTGVERRDVEGENHGLYGESRDEDVKTQISESLTGREFSAETRQLMADSHLGNEITDSTRQQISEALTGVSKDPETRRKMSEAREGENNPSWKGGGSERYGPGWKAARERVRDRDGICQNCGHDGTESRLEVHHIIPVRRFADGANTTLGDAHDLRNLILLCKDCHLAVHEGPLSFETPVEPPESREG